MIYNPPMSSQEHAPSPAIQTPQRFHGFDFLRGGAMLLGVVQHAAMAYMVRPMDKVLWPLRADTVPGGTQPSNTFFDLLLWWVHCWRIPMFYVIGGFFAAMLVRRRGAGGYIHHRIQRVVIPVAVATVTILTAMYVIWAWGWVTEGRAEWREVWRTSFDDPQLEAGKVSTGHLWFLYYLLAFSFVYWAVLKVRRRAQPGDIEPGRVCKTLFGSAWAPLVLMLPTIGAITAFPGFFLAHDHPVPLNGGQALHELLQHAYQGYYFLVGVYLFRMHRQLQVLARWAWAYLIGANLAFALAMVLAWRYFDHLDHGTAFGLFERLGLATSLSLFCWLMIWGTLGLGLGVLAENRHWVRWLSDSAYWVYLIHLPIVGVMMMLVRHWPSSPFAKYAIVLGVASAVSLLTYQIGVRYTIIGRFLHGPRHRPGTES